MKVKIQDNFNGGIIEEEITPIYINAITSMIGNIIQH